MDSNNQNEQYDIIDILDKEHTNVLYTNDIKLKTEFWLEHNLNKKDELEYKLLEELLQKYKKIEYQRIVDKNKFIKELDLSHGYHYSIDGDKIPNNYEYNVDGDLVPKKINNYNDSGYKHCPTCNYVVDSDGYCKRCNIY